MLLLKYMGVLLSEILAMKKAPLATIRGLIFDKYTALECMFSLIFLIHYYILVYLSVL